MTVTPPSGIQITKGSGLYLPAMAAEPLLTALENCNYLLQYHRPPLVSVCYTATDALTRQSIYIVPVIPSADDLRYTFEHRIVCSSASQAITITVDETATYAGAGTSWSNIYSQGITSNGTGGLLTTQVDTDKTVDKTTTALRITYTAPAAGNRNDHHVLAYPSPAAASAGILTGSGAVPFDDGLISGADRAAVHTEWINRCKTTAVAVLQDRKQNCLSFVQDESTRAYNWITPVDSFKPLPPGRIWLPHQSGPVTVDLRVLATMVTPGAGPQRVRIRQTGTQAGETVFFAADGAVKSGTITLQVKGEGAQRYADVEIAVRRVGAETSTELMAVMGYYTPGQ